MFSMEFTAFWHCNLIILYPNVVVGSLYGYVNLSLIHRLVAMVDDLFVAENFYYLENCYIFSTQKLSLGFLFLFDSIYFAAIKKCETWITTFALIYLYLCSKTVPIPYSEATYAITMSIAGSKWARDKSRIREVLF